MRWRYGETNPVIAWVSEGHGVEIGDLLMYDSEGARPASTHENKSDKATTQSTFASKFLGVAMQKSPLGESTQIRVATSGVFEFEPVSPIKPDLGAIIGVGESTDRTAVCSQKVDTAVSGGLIGRVVRREPTATQKILITIKSKIINP